jgi:uncharacterized protein (DUF486 family)
MDMLYKGFWPAVMLVASNIFMTFAWYGHLKYAEKGKWALWLVILASWGIAFFEYLLMVPANRIGAENGLTAGQLKIMQEMITLAVFAVFAATYLKETLTWRYYAAFALVIAAVILVFSDRK